jgi:hypothetical protein
MQVEALKQNPRSTRTTTGCYLYAVIDCPEDRQLNVAGMDGGAVRAVSDGLVAAVISDVPNGRIRPERRRLAAHHEVLKRLREDFTVLPMSFGLIAGDLEGIRKILRLNQEALGAELARLRNKVEMGLHVYWDVPNIFEFFVARHTLLRQLRDELFRNGREPAQNDKIELGRTFDRVMTEERAEQTAKIIGVLDRCCAEIKENKPRNERELTNLACLIDGAGQRRFEEAVLEAAQLFDNHYSFDFNGPWPPHNFVELNLQME